MKVLDLFCGAGGMSMGYHQAGLEVVGVDIKQFKRYPFEQLCGDWHEVLTAIGTDSFDLIHASPPCQHYSRMTKTAGTQANHPDLIADVRTVLRASGKPYVIENVKGAPLEAPTMLCGRMFDLPLYRHRLFETSFLVVAPEHPKHLVRASSAGHYEPGTIISVAGHFAPVQLGRDAMGIQWMTQHELAEAIPPAYGKFIGSAFLASLSC